MNCGLLIEKSIMMSQIINRLLTVTRLDTTVVPVYLLPSNDRQLPEQVVSHYKINMVADDKMHKILFSVTRLVMSFLVGIRSGVGPQFLIRRFPTLFSIPTKEFWLADDSPETTLNTIGTYMLQSGIGSMLMIACIIHASINSTLSVQNNSNSMIWMVLGGFGLYTTILIMHLTHRFRHDPPRVIEEA